MKVHRCNKVSAGQAAPLGRSTYGSFPAADRCRGESRRQASLADHVPLGPRCRVSWSERAVHPLNTCTSVTFSSEANQDRIPENPELGNSVSVGQCVSSSVALCPTSNIRPPISDLRTLNDKLGTENVELGTPLPLPVSGNAQHVLELAQSHAGQGYQDQIIAAHDEKDLGIAKGLGGQDLCLPGQLNAGDNIGQ